jgi:hypothetical protein
VVKNGVFWHGHCDASAPHLLIAALAYPAVAVGVMLGVVRKD